MHNKTKHVARRHFYVRDMVEEHELEVPFVRTHDNVADFLTKPMKSSSTFFTMRSIIMNEPAHAPAASSAGEDTLSDASTDWGPAESLDGATDHPRVSPSRSEGGASKVNGGLCVSRD